MALLRGDQEKRVGYRPDHKSFGAFLLSDQARDPVVEAAHNIATLAALRAPKGGSGDTAASYKVNENSAPVLIASNLRVGAEVYNDATHEGAEKSYAAAAEFGKKDSPGHRSLGKAGAELGQMSGEPG